MLIERRTIRCRMRLASIMVVLLSVAAPPRVVAFEPRPVPGRILLQLHDHVDASAFTTASGGAIDASQLRAHVPGLAGLAERFRITSFRPHFPGAAAGKAGPGPDLSRFFIVDFPPELDLEDVRRAYAADASVRIAEYDWMQPLHYEPNDIANAWHIESSTGRDAHVTGGWNHSRGDPAVVIGILDSGVDWQHPDLGGSGPDYTDGNIWTNAAELHGTPGRDDDENGYVDDIRGWDFVLDMGTPWPGEDATTPDNDPRDFHGHGTHVAGIAGAITDNGIGVAGVGFNCKVMALRIGGSIHVDGRQEGVVFMSTAAAGIEYARQQGATVLNCSWGSNSVAALVAAVNRAVAANIVFCVSAGNDNADVPGYLAQRGDCIDVAASTGTDHRAAFSNFGGWVDVTAPGAEIYSTLFDHTLTGGAAHKYGLKSGTSMAAPVVAGLAALVRAREPWLTASEVRARIMAGADPIDARNPGDAGKLGAGRVNALRTFKDRFLTVPGDYPSIAKALIASGINDTLALRGGPSGLPPLFLNVEQRSILGAWNADFSRRDLAVPTIVDAGGNGPALEIAPGMDRTLVVDGFVFRGGSGRVLAGRAGMFGGGILCIGASPTLRNCTFAGNVVGRDGEPGAGGGGGYFDNSAARLEGCRFDANAAREGCGAYVIGSDLEMIDCSFSSNTASFAASGHGAGLLAESSVVTITRGRFEGNSGAQEGGGIYVRGGSVVLEDVQFACNAAAYQGGGMLVGAGSVVEIRNSSFHNCNAAVGGGVALAPGSTLNAFGVRWSRNMVTALGGGIFANGARATLVNCTWDSNFGGIGGGGAIQSAQASAAWVVRNSIVTNHVQVAMRFVSTPVDLAYNVYWNNVVDIDGGELGPAALRADPRFVGPGDYELGVHSPAIDSGDPDPQLVDADATRNNRGAHGGPAARSRAPHRPGTLVVSRKSDHNEIAWAAAAGEVAYYVVYRGDAGFSPSEANAIATVPAGDTAFLDAGGTPQHWYTLAAVGPTGAASGFSDFQPTPADPTSGELTLPARLVLYENEPNPFNPRTRIRVDLPRQDHVRLDIYDVRGRVVRRLVDAHVQAGQREFVWDGRDDAGLALGSGTYVYRLRTTSDDATRKMTLLR